MLPAPAATGIFPTLFLRICPVMPEPIPRRVPLSAFAWFFLSVIGLPQEMIWIGFPASFREHDFSRARFRGCSYFVMFRPHSLLASQVAPTAASYRAGRPRLLRPSRTCVVTFARIGYAFRPTTGNWRNEDFHLARFTVLSAAHISALAVFSHPIFHPWLFHPGVESACKDDKASRDPLPVF